MSPLAFSLSPLLYPPYCLEGWSSRKQASTVLDNHLPEARGCLLTGAEEAGEGILIYAQSKRAGGERTKWVLSECPSGG